MHGYRTNSCVSGRWSRETPVCVASGCPSPGNLQHGATSLMEDGSWVLFRCDAGYRLYGHSLLYCKGQNWNGTKPVCKESDIMSGRQHPEPAASVLRIQNPNNDAHVALKSRLQIHYDTVANTAFKEVFLKTVHTHLKDPRGLDLNPKTHIIKGILTDTMVFTGREGALQKPTRAKTSTSLATTETFTPRSVLAVSSGGKYGHQGSSVAQPELEDSLPRKEVLMGATHAKPGQGITEAADVSGIHPETHTVSQQPHPQTHTEPNSTSQASMEPLSSKVSPTEVSPFGVSPSPTHTWGSLLSTLLHTPRESAFLSQSVSVRNHIFNASSTNNTNTSYGDVSNAVQENRTDTSDSSRDRANKALSSLLEADVTSPELARNSSAYHLLKFAPVEAQATETEKHNSHGSKAKETESWSVGDDDETSLHTIASPDTAPSFKLDRRPVTGHTEERPRTGTVNRRPVCPYPPFPVHGTFYFRTVEKPGLQDYKHYIQYACYAGYTLAHGNPHSYCLQGGHWSGVTPVCLEVTPCSLNNGGCSQLCTLDQDQARCHCRPGFTLLEDQRTCRDVDECVEGRRRCQQTCVNTFGSFHCSCPYGQTLAGDGRTCVAQCPAGYRRHPSNPVPGPSSREECVDINECEQRGAGEPANRCEWKCVNLLGSHRCICPKGYHLDSDGWRCQDVNECSRRNGGCSHLCLNLKGSYKCVCPKSHRLSLYSKKKCQPRK
ncbi:uncharacterized protein LOC109614922 [Esox lucius]|uniref:uncharacterized protein LOC109614922 n=1 Tax=Esox lucius TaxID=8010 RepID=UPI0014768F47|nr:uncharacterized protein LOC109614922 [Esox lucius]